MLFAATHEQLVCVKMSVIGGVLAGIIGMIALYIWIIRKNGREGFRKFLFEACGTVVALMTTTPFVISAPLSREVVTVGIIFFGSLIVGCLFGILFVSGIHFLNGSGTRSASYNE